MPVFGSAQKFGTVKRLEEVASARDFETSTGVTYTVPAFFRSTSTWIDRVIERLDDLEVPQPGNLRHLGRRLFPRRGGSG